MKTDKGRRIKVYSYNDVMTFVKEEDVKFIRLAFCDVFGKQKNISIMPEELKRAFTDGISFDASAITGFLDVVKSDLLLYPDPSTFSVLPWRPARGRVVRMFCDIKYPDGKPYERDSRQMLKRTAAEAKKKGLAFYFGSEVEFYLFKTDEEGKATKTPFDEAGYMDIAPLDKGENVRREICLTLADMGIMPESSHHEMGPGQNEIDFRYSGALTAADNAVTFKSVVETIAMRNGLFADFSPKPLENFPGNGMHINMSVKSENAKDYTEQFIAGILEHISEMTLFLNNCDASYNRLGQMKAPKYITWSKQNRSQLIRIPAAKGEYARIELRSPDPAANPYIAYTLLIKAGIEGITRGLKLAPAVNENLYCADKTLLDGLKKLPSSKEEAYLCAKKSSFINEALPEGILEQYK